MNRRDFISGAAATSMGIAMAMSAIELRAAAAEGDAPAGPPVNCAVIGLGLWGREMLTSLAKLGASRAPVTKICDSFTAPSFVRKASAIAPTAEVVDDYRKVLDDKAVQAVLIATPTFKHKQIVLDALQAGKHVYCEAPLASDLAEAKIIAQAGAAAKPFFMPGLQIRNNAQNLHVLKFIRSQALGKTAFGTGQWHDRTKWKQSWPDEARALELNWRISNATSMGLLGEVGIHQIDEASWFFNALPTSVTGYGSIVEQVPGRDILDTVEVVVQYPNNIRFLYDATLTNSYDGAYEMYYGTLSAIQMRDQRAWMFKESDADTIGWETFARKDNMVIGDPSAGTGIRLGTGIALVADASKQIALGKDPAKSGTDVSKTSLYQSLDHFTSSIGANTKPNIGPLEGYQATVVAHKCNEAAMTGTTVAIPPDALAL